MESSAQRIEFKYDHNGMRVEKKVTAKGDNTTETTQYFYHGKKLMRQVKGNHVLHFYYDAEGRPAMVMYNGVMYTYAHSLQGDIAAIVDSSGNLVVEYKYDAWGNITTSFGTLKDTLGKLNPFRYRGYVYDVETALYYLPARYYNPAFCRWINLDDTAYLSMEGELLRCNLYSYCVNAATIAYDPSGHLFWSMVIGGAVGAIVSGISYGVKQSILGKDFEWSGFATACITGAIVGATGAFVGATAMTSSVRMFDAIKYGSAAVGICAGTMAAADADGNPVFEGLVVGTTAAVSTALGAFLGIQAVGAAAYFAEFAIDLSAAVWFEIISLGARLGGIKFKQSIEAFIAEDRERSKTIAECYESAKNYHYKTGGDRRSGLASVN